MGGQEGVGDVDGWGAKSGLFNTFEMKSSSVHCLFIEVYKYPQFTCQADTVADSSLTPSVALLVRPNDAAHSIVDHHEFTGSQK